MTVTYNVKPIGQLNASINVTKDGKISKQLQVVYRVRTTSVGEEGLKEALENTPPLNSLHSIDTSLRLTSKKVQQTSSPVDFDVVCIFSYETATAEGTPPGYPDEQPIPPLDRPIEITFTSELVDREITKDITGKPIRNTAKQPFDPPLTRSRARINLQIRKNLSTSQFSPLRFTKFVSSVNSKEFLGFKKGTVMFLEFTNEPMQYEMGQYYIPCTFTFKIDPEGWEPVLVANIGTVYYTAECNCDEDGNIINLNQGGCRKVATTEDGFVTSDRVFLDLCGKRTDQPIFLPFNIYPFADFDDILG